MTITIMTDYLVFPVYTYATDKKLVFQYEGETVYQLNIKLDNASPDFYAYIDVSRFKGKDLELSVLPEMEIAFGETDEMDICNLYREPIRPQAHFTPKNGFIKAVESMIYSDGLYHIHYQYNPAGKEAENFHLGHATSKDLIHWQEEKISAFPDEITVMDSESPKIFSLTDSEGDQKWISMNEKGEYFVGHVENGQFQAEQSACRFRYENSDCAGKVFTDPKNGRVIYMDWNCMDFPQSGFCGQMGVPTELSLEKHDALYYLRVLPIKEMDILYKNTNRYKDIKVTKTMEIPLADAAQSIHLGGKFEENAVLNLNIFGRTLQIDFSENQISVGEDKAPLFLTEKGLDLTLLVDRCSVEIFADGGKIYLYSLSKDTVMDRNLLSMILSCNMDYALDFVEIHALEPIWQTSPKKF